MPAYIHRHQPHDKQTNRKAGRQTDRRAHQHTDRLETDIHAQTHRPADRQTDGLTDGRWIGKFQNEQ